MPNFQRDFAVFALVAMLGIYIAPVVGMTFAIPVGFGSGEDLLGKMFLSIVASPTSLGSIVQKLLLPISAGITVAVLWQRPGVAITLLTIAALGIVCSLFLILYFNIPTAAKDLWGPADFENIQTSKQFVIIKDQYLSGVIEALGTYLLFLLGIKASPLTTQAKNEAKANDA